jgi:small subunit ribosomal protein S1
MVDAKVTSYDAKSRKISLSIKALEISDEKKAIEQYGSKDSGASLGDILGEALDKSSSSTDEDDKKND